MSGLKSLDRGELYTVGWIAALSNELAAALAMLDERHGKPNDFKKPFSDKNSYHWGRIGDHNIVIASLAAGIYGTTSAATTAMHMLSSFPNIKVGLMVGIGAGIARPKQERDIRLGDIAVSLPRGQSGGVIQYDLGKSRVSGGQGHATQTFERVGFLNSPPEALLKALTTLRAQVRLEGSKVSSLLEDMLKRYPQMAEDELDEPGYVYQGQENDTLFEASYIHASDTGCEDCDSTRIVPRAARRNPDVPRVHYGVIASGNKLIKDAVERDLILKEVGQDCICLEMEAAGLTNSFPCLVIRGICDYADSHKSDEWQEYAAATAAAYAKEFLGFVEEQDLAQTTRAVDLLQNISNSIIKIASTVKDTGEDVQNLRRSHHENEIRDWLSAAEPSTNYVNALEKRHKGSGTWFTGGKAFADWKNRSKSFLWLHGVPGCGKTVLSSTIIEHLSNITTPDQVLLYFYFDFNATNKQTLENMLRSLISQLYQQQPDAQGPLDQLRESTRGGSQNLSKQSLSGVLLAMLSKVNNVSIVLDALDESSTRNDVLAWLWGVLAAECFAGRILITARREADIESGLQRWILPDQSISIQGDDVNDDISAYVVHRVRNSEELERWHNMPEVQHEIEKELVENADGMFRWVACQIDALKDCLDYPRLRQALRNLPKTLDETYSRILESIPREHSAQAATILNLLVWSNGEYRIDQLVDAIAIDLDKDPAFDPKNRMPVPRDLLKLCSGLVTVYQCPLGEHSGNDVVYLAHFSVKEYLVSNHVSKAFRSLIDEPVAKSYLARLCLKYLVCVSHIVSEDSQLILDAWDQAAQFPMTIYSVYLWTDLSRELEYGDDGLFNMVMNFFTIEHNAFCLFREILEDGDHLPLYYAAQEGLGRAIIHLLDHGADINANGGEALQAALERARTTILHLLLDKGADVNAGDGQALLTASRSGNDSAVGLLLDCGADINAGDGQALCAASARSRDTTFQLLLDSGADVNAGDGRVLLTASRSGNDVAVELLLKRGVSPNAQSQSTPTALQEALRCGYTQLVRRLLEDVGGRAKQLETNMVKSYHKIIRLLVDKGADTNVPGGEWFDTLCAGRWSADIVQRVLEKNAFLSANHLLSAMLDVDPQAERIVSVMVPYLTRKVAVQEHSFYRMNLLHFAAICGSEIVTQRCLDLEVDIHARDEHGKTALHLAAISGRNLAVVKMLIQVGSDIDARCRNHKTPLYYAQHRAYSASNEANTEIITSLCDIIEHLSDVAQKNIAEFSVDQSRKKKRKRFAKHPCSDDSSSEDPEGWRERYANIGRDFLKDSSEF
ncbi:Pfs, NACHT and ankyrin domain protein [Aureobasidium sp. EXF-8845]|nr:Pfs, NACHT and ankyrin domain protein [Aureobasidium sp. EXF-8845]KAI4857141.1 Pfs, NACHT and ankyrin domain protein [Aureobasidium sp. EXF-8846]